MLSYLHEFSSPSSLLLRRRTYTHTHTSALSLTLFQFTQAPPEPGYHGNAGMVENPSTSHRSLWTARENNRENGRLGRRALGIYRIRVESRVSSMQRWRAEWLMEWRPAGMKSAGAGGHSDSHSSGPGSKPAVEFYFSFLRIRRLQLTACEFIRRSVFYMFVWSFVKSGPPLGNKSRLCFS